MMTKDELKPKIAKYVHNKVLCILECLYPFYCIIINYYMLEIFVPSFLTDRMARIYHIACPDTWLTSGFVKHILSTSEALYITQKINISK